MTLSDHTKAAIYASMKPYPFDKESFGSHPETLKAAEEELKPKQREGRNLKAIRRRGILLVTIGGHVMTHWVRLCPQRHELLGFQATEPGPSIVFFCFF